MLRAVFLFPVLLAIASLRVQAAALDVFVEDSTGAPVQDAVASLLPVDHAAPTMSARTTAVIDQRGLKFVPRVLPVQAGTLVEFPNSDQVRHHVYSFSTAKTFELRLYKGKPADPELFDKAGVAVLGCNIHDWMLGYVYVVDTPWFAKSDAAGHLRIENVPAGDYRLEVWHPRLQAAPKNFSEPVRVTAAQATHKVVLAVAAPEPEPDPPSELEQKFRKYQKHADGQ